MMEVRPGDRARAEKSAAAVMGLREEPVWEEPELEREVMLELVDRACRME